MLHANKYIKQRSSQETFLLIHSLCVSPVFFQRSKLNFELNFCNSLSPSVGSPTVCFSISDTGCPALRGLQVVRCLIMLV